MPRLLHYACSDDMTDPTNIQKKQSLRNSSKYAYNCGGYALNTFNWYQPQYKKDDLYFSPRDKATDYMVKCMLEDFKGRLRIIDNENEIAEDEICVAFRIGWGDFHYAKLGKNKQWRHKRGDRNWIEYMTKEEVYSSDGWYDGKYDGKLVLMALKNS